MNLFRFAGDMSHLASFFLLIWRLHSKRNANGISLRAQELYLLVFVTRYLDLFFKFYSLYNTAMKLFYIGASGLIVYALRQREPWRSSYATNTSPSDSFPHWLFLALPCAALALLVNEASLGGLARGAVVGAGGAGHYFFEACWAFSEYLEAVAIFPQIWVMHKNKSAENITAWYLISLGAYRALYVCNWVYRAYTEKDYRRVSRCVLRRASAARANAAQRPFLPNARSLTNPKLSRSSSGPAQLSPPSPSAWISWVSGTVQTASALADDPPSTTFQTPL